MVIVFLVIISAINAQVITCKAYKDHKTQLEKELGTSKGKCYTDLYHILYDILFKATTHCKDLCKISYHRLMAQFSDTRMISLQQNIHSNIW